MIIKKIMSTPQKSTKITSDIFGEEIIKKIKKFITKIFQKDLPKSSEDAHKYKTNLKTAIENVFENNGFTNKDQSAQILAFINNDSFKNEVETQLKQMTQQEKDPAGDYIKVEEEQIGKGWELVDLPTE